MKRTFYYFLVGGAESEIFSSVPFLWLFRLLWDGGYLGKQFILRSGHLGLRGPTPQGNAVDDGAPNL